MEERDYYRKRPRTFVLKRTVARSQSIFLNTCVFCATAIVVAITVKVILSLF